MDLLFFRRSFRNSSTHCFRVRLLILGTMPCDPASPRLLPTRNTKYPSPLASRTRWPRRSSSSLTAFKFSIAGSAQKPAPCAMMKPTVGFGVLPCDHSIRFWNRRILRFSDGRFSTFFPNRKRKFISLAYNPRNGQSFSFPDWRLRAFARRAPRPPESTFFPMRRSELSRRISTDISRNTSAAASTMASGLERIRKSPMSAAFGKISLTTSSA